MTHVPAQPHEPNDSDWRNLLDERNIDVTRQEGERQYERLSTEEAYELRRMCKTDLFFLCNTILGYKRLSTDLHAHMAAWTARTSWEQFREMLLPRSHFKTTFWTIGESIQAALPCDKGVEVAYPRNLGTDIRILLGHETQGPPGGSSRFLYEITSHLTGNPRLVGLFPETVPRPRMQRMNTFELELPRKEHWAEPTFDTIGVGGRAQGRHYNFIKLDDIFGDKARDSKAERDGLIQWFDNIQAFLVRLAYDHIDLIGTRYSLNDVYAHAMKVYDKRIIKYIRRILEKNPRTGILEPIFPEEFTLESLAILRKNAKVWSAQYVNDPHEGLAEWNVDWKRWFYWAGPGRIGAFMGGQNPTVQHVRDLDRVILIDPSVSLSPGIIVTGSDDRNRKYVLEAIKKPMNPPQFIDTLFKLVQKWNPRIVSIEEVVFSALYKHWLEREMKIRNQRFLIYPYKPPKNKLKVERVRQLANNFAAGEIFFHESQTDLIEEFDNFGATDDYHLLDAMAQGIEVWRAGVPQNVVEKMKREEEELMKERDIQTGYST